MLTAMQTLGKKGRPDFSKVMQSLQPGRSPVVPSPWKLQPVGQSLTPVTLWPDTHEKWGYGQERQDGLGQRYAKPYLPGLSAARLAC